MLERSVSEVRARVDVRPYARRRPRPLGRQRPDARARRRPAAGRRRPRPRDQPGGHLAGPAHRPRAGRARPRPRHRLRRAVAAPRRPRRAVVATDVNERALRLPVQRRLNDVDGRRPRGSFFEPVRRRAVRPGRHQPAVRDLAGRPASGSSTATRGCPGDQVVEHIVRERARAPAPRRHRPRCWPTGRSWATSRGRSGSPAGCPAAATPGWCSARSLDLPAYVELWLKDAGVHGRPDYPERYDTWLSWFEEQGAEAVGFGWINLRRTGASQPDVRLEEWPYDVEQPLGPEVAAHFERVATLRVARRRRPAGQPARGPLRRAPGDVRRAGGRGPEQIVLRQQRWMRRARQVDTVEAALVGACDGELTVGQILGRPGATARRGSGRPARQLSRRGPGPGRRGIPRAPDRGDTGTERLSRRATLTTLHGSDAP